MLNIINRLPTLSKSKCNECLIMITNVKQLLHILRLIWVETRSFYLYIIYLIFKFKYQFNIIYTFIKKHFNILHKT